MPTGKISSKLIDKKDHFAITVLKKYRSITPSFIYLLCLPAFVTLLQCSFMFCQENNAVSV